MSIMLIATTTQARIGETKEEFTVRYGAPFLTKEGGYFYYQKEGFLLTAHFYQNKCDFIAFCKTGNGPDGTSPMSDTEIETLLKASGNNQPWQLVNTHQNKKMWQTENKELNAIYYAVGANSLVISTADWAKRETDSTNNKEQEKLKEF